MSGRSSWSHLSRLQYITCYTNFKNSCTQKQTVLYSSETSTGWKIMYETRNLKVLKLGCCQISLISWLKYRNSDDWRPFKYLIWSPLTTVKLSMLEMWGDYPYWKELYMREEKNRHNDEHSHASNQNSQWSKLCFSFLLLIRSSMNVDFWMLSTTANLFRPAISKYSFKLLQIIVERQNRFVK